MNRRITCGAATPRSRSRHGHALRLGTDPLTRIPRPTQRRGFLFTVVLCSAAQLAACGGETSTATPQDRSTRVELEGQVEALVEDYPGYARTRQFLTTDDGRVELQFQGTAPELRTGTRIRVQGIQNGDVLALDGSAGSITAVAPTASRSTALASTASALTALANTFGEQRTLVILVNFQDKPTEQPWTVDQVRGSVFGTVSNFYLESSYQQTWLSGDVVGWYTIPVNSTACDQLGIASHAKQAATTAGANLSAYTRYVYLFPTSSCQWSGTATVGGSPSQAWINGHLELGVVGHEMGHNFGLEHSHSLVCSGATIGAGCSTLEYGDGIDIMGWSPSAHFNAFQKERLGWLNSGVSPPITTVLASGDYSIDPYALPGTSPKALKILKSTDPTTGARTWYYVEYRQAVGFDGVLASGGSLMNASNILNGVVIHTGAEDNGGYDNHLLDMTPETYALYTRDPALDVGKSFSDPDAGVTITALWANGANAGVRVSLSQSSCVRANPTVAVSPSSQSAPAGASVTYSIAVANNDGAGCAASSFDLQAAVPSGWTASIASPTLTVVPGASASTTLMVASPVTASARSYTVGVSAANGANAAYAATGTATYSIASALATTVSTDKSSYAKGAQVAISDVVTSGGKAVPNAAVNFTVTKPNGVVVTQSGITNTNGLAVYNLRLNKQKDPAGTYQVRVIATSNGASASAATSFTVQ